MGQDCTNCTLGTVKLNHNEAVIRRQITVGGHYPAMSGVRVRNSSVVLCIGDTSSRKHIFVLFLSFLYIFVSDVLCMIGK